VRYLDSVLSLRKSADADMNQLEQARSVLFYQFTDVFFAVVIFCFSVEDEQEFWVCIISFRYKISCLNFNKHVVTVNINLADNRICGKC